MKGDVDMSATTSVTGGGGLERDREEFSDDEVKYIAKKETEVELFIIDKNKTSRWIILSIS